MQLPCKKWAWLLPYRDCQPTVTFFLFVILKTQKLIFPWSIHSSQRTTRFSNYVLRPLIGIKGSPAAVRKLKCEIIDLIGRGTKKMCQTHPIYKDESVDIVVSAITTIKV